MNDVNNTYIEETITATEEVATEAIGSNWEEDIRIRSLKTGDQFDTSFFGSGLRMSIAIYILVIFGLLSMLLPFTNATLLTKGTTSKKYESIMPMRDKEVSPLYWSEKYSSNGFDVILGKTIDFVNNNGLRTMRIPSADDITIEAAELSNVRLYLSYGSIFGALIPIIFIYIAILVASREQWTNGNGFLFSGILAVLNVIVYAYLYFDICGGINDLFIKDKYGKDTPKILMDVFSRLGIGFWIGIVISIVIAVFCFIAKAKIKSGKNPFISKADQREYAAAMASKESAEEVVEAEVVEEAVAVAAE